MKLEGEGETKLVRKTRVRRKCDNCSNFATRRHTYLRPNARNNPASSACGRDDCSWCSDFDLYLCDGCRPRDCEDIIPNGYGPCAEFKVSERFAHMFLRWEEEEVEP